MILEDVSLTAQETEILTSQRAGTAGPAAGGSLTGSGHIGPGAVRSTLCPSAEPRQPSPGENQLWGKLSDQETVQPKA